MSRSRVPKQGERGHTWRLDESGEIDIFGLEYDIHNGPVCTTCDYSYCIHCDKGPSQDCKAVKP